MNRGFLIFSCSYCLKVSSFYSKTNWSVLWYTLREIFVSFLPCLSKNYRQWQMQVWSRDTTPRKNRTYKTLVKRMGLGWNFHHVLLTLPRENTRSGLETCVLHKGFVIEIRRHNSLAYYMHITWEFHNFFDPIRFTQFPDLLQTKYILGSVWEYIVKYK